jgi:chitinase
VKLTEGNSGLKNFTFTVTRSGNTSGTSVVHFSTANGTASSASDYVAKSGTLTFSSGQLTKTVTVQVKGDTAVEGNEVLFVNLFSPTGAAIADGSGKGTILNDDQPPKPMVSITDVTGVEGNTGTRLFTFTITLSAPAPGAISVNYATSNGTASAGGDYTAASGSVHFTAGQTSKQVTISVKGDTTKEADETFFISLSNAIGATINKGVGKGTIRNDD